MRAEMLGSLTVPPDLIKCPNPTCGLLVEGNPPRAIDQTDGRYLRAYVCMCGFTVSAKYVVKR